MVLVLKMLVGSELRKQGEEHVQTLHHRFIVRQLVAGDVHHRAYQSRIVRGVHVDFWTWEGDFSQGLLHLRTPLLHEGLNIRHLLGVVHSWRRPCLVEILHTFNPTRNLLGLLVSILY